MARCACGQLRLSVTVEPVHVHACTCTRCQVSSGSVGGWNGWFPMSGVRVEGEATRFARARGGEAAGVESWSCFCPVCGSGGYGVTAEFLPDCYVIPMGTFARPEGPEVPGPTMVHHWANRPGWVDHMGNLPGAGVEVR